jgi:hypothetical protein
MLCRVASGIFPQTTGISISMVLPSGLMRTQACNPKGSRKLTGLFPQNTYWFIVALRKNDLKRSGKSAPRPAPHSLFKEQFYYRKVYLKTVLEGRKNVLKSAALLQNKEACWLHMGLWLMPVTKSPLEHPLDKMTSGNLIRIHPGHLRKPGIPTRRKRNDDTPT